MGHNFAASVSQFVRPSSNIWAITWCLVMHHGLSSPPLCAVLCLHFCCINPLLQCLFSHFYIGLLFPMLCNLLFFNTLSLSSF